MSLRIHNTLSGEKETFVPRDARRVTMYVCGPTVYGLAHIGNARPAVVFDTLFRLLRARFGEVVYARNITDIDDKIIAASRESGRETSELAADFAARYRRDMAALNVLEPTIEPRATAHMAAMIELAGELLERGHAYRAEGHLLFAVRSKPDYGKLSRRSLDDMLAGARVEVADYKRHPGDFVLWKPAAGGEPGWDSPWGRGRPGWHLECSAMIHSHFGSAIDIHGGGRDLIFPHHENELAQSECAHGGAFVKYWMHNAHVDIDGGKMAKSLGNFRAVRELLGKYPGEALRFALLSAHYRSNLDFSAELLEQARAALDRLYAALREARDVAPQPAELAREPFMRALEDDLNTPRAIAELHSLARSLNRAGGARRAALKGRLLAAAELLGILRQAPERWFHGALAGGLSADAVEELVARRLRARRDRDFALADRIREQLRGHGVLLDDSRDGTTWRRA